MTDSSEIIESAACALQQLDDNIVGLKDQEKYVEDLIIDFKTSKKGQCCLLEGEANCGRESLLKKILKKYKLYLRVINVAYIAADPLIQETISREDDDDGCSVFLVRDADELLTAHQQEFLYTMTDKATSNAWLVFFSITRHNFTQNLEKRGNSRMPRIRVTFDQAANFEDYCEAFHSFMIPECSSEFPESYIKLIENLNYNKWLKPVFERYNYDVLKQICAQILMRLSYVENEQIEDNEIVSIINESLEFLNLGLNRRIEILKDSSLRSQCVFLCAHRIVKNKPSDGELLTPKTTYRTIFLEYKKLANTHYPILNVHSDVFVFREIDHLVELGLLRADKSANLANISFRKVWVDVDSLIIEKSIPHLKMPTVVKEFFSTVVQ